MTNVDTIENEDGRARSLPDRCIVAEGRCAAGCAVAMLGFAAGLLVVAPPAWAADEPTRIQPAAEGVGATAVRVQPIAKQFARPISPTSPTAARARSRSSFANSCVHRRRPHRVPHLLAAPSDDAILRRLGAAGRRFDGTAVRERMFFQARR